MNLKNRKDQALVGLLVLALISGFRCQAGDGAALSGIVTDPSGAIVAGVNVEVQNSETAFRKALPTGSDGAYAFFGLAPGKYELRIDCSGFKSYRQTGIEIVANAAVKLDVALELASEHAAVTVAEAVAALDTSTTQAGQAIAAAKMTAVPLNGRSFTDMLALQRASSRRIRSNPVQW